MVAQTRAEPVPELTFKTSPGRNEPLGKKTSDCESV